MIAAPARLHIADPAPEWDRTEQAFREYLLSHRRGANTAITYSRSVTRFARWCLSRSVDPVQASDVHVGAYVAALYQKQLSHNTIPLTLSTIRAFYEFAIARGWREDDPTSGLSVKWHDAKPRRPLSAPELRALLAACRNKRDRLMISLAYVTGLRIAELIGLREADIDFDRGVVLVRGKGGKERHIAPGPDLLLQLRAYCGHAGGVLWRTKTGEPMSIKRAQRAMEQIARRAGVRAHWHKLRTTFACDALDAGLAIEELRVVMGHASIEETAHYAGYRIGSVALEHMKALNLSERLEEGAAWTRTA